MFVEGASCNKNPPRPTCTILQSCADEEGRGCTSHPHPNFTQDFNYFKRHTQNNLDVLFSHGDWVDSTGNQISAISCLNIPDLNLPSGQVVFKEFPFTIEPKQLELEVGETKELSVSCFPVTWQQKKSSARELGGKKFRVRWMLWGSHPLEMKYKSFL